MSQDNHQIDADDRSVSEVLKDKKYGVDYFQREYNWEQKHIQQLVTDLTSTFLDNYREGDEREAVRGYNSYYLGPFVVSSKSSSRSIIDGQQRLTSLTLLLIYLYHMQQNQAGSESIRPLIYSESYGKKSFNIEVKEREHCFEQLLNQGTYDVRDNDDESTRNMAQRYADIAEAFPDEIKKRALPYFIDWLKERVILVEITAYSDDNAYTIFESMNDRGLNLTPSEMLKGYILSRFKDGTERDQANQLWRQEIQKLHAFAKDEDQKFFQAWLRSRYADTIRQSRAGSANEDFEKIGTRFHAWFRDNLKKMGLDTDKATGFRTLIFKELVYYLKSYVQILEAQQKEKEGWEPVFYQYHCGIADSLALPLMLAPLNSEDNDEITREKINAVAAYMEEFAVRRSVNFRNFAASSIRYTMYSLVKEIRNKGLPELRSILNDKLNAMEETWAGVAEFQLHGMNKWFVKYLLSRITAFIEQRAGITTIFSTYFLNSGTKPFEVEHIWADKFEEHRAEFEQRADFEDYRNRIGDLVLLTRGTNQSYGAMSYQEKVEHYLKENLLAKSLNQKAYENNPNFLGMASRLGLPFKPYANFNRSAIDERQALIQKICEVLWMERID